MSTHKSNVIVTRTSRFAYMHANQEGIGNAGSLPRRYQASTFSMNLCDFPSGSANSSAYTRNVAKLFEALLVHFPPASFQSLGVARWIHTAADYVK